MKTTLPIRPGSRVGSFLKAFICILVVVFVLNLYSTSNYTELWRKFRDENVTIQRIQEKVSELVQNGFAAAPSAGFQNFDGENSKDFDEMTEKERAEWLGLDDGITDETRRIMQELNVTDAGENGTAVVYDLSKSEFAQKVDRMLRKTYGYNGLASSMVSLNRALPDNRSEYCKNKKYPMDLPKASVVIPFHDDDWMLLMRTVHSVMLRTPDRLLEEVLLVFDYSEREYYQEKLNEYIKKYPKIRLIRSHRRQGIIPTRIMGGRNAVGPVIVYLDSHVEVTPGWIEPMLARIAEQPNVLAWAKISDIGSENLQVSLNDSPGGLGTFSWDLVFKWMDIGYFEGDNPTPKYEPKPTITIIGPCYAIRKDFYHKIGLLDPDFDIWGAEDVELALRTWMCGGRVEMIPCAVVAHMFKSHTYTTATEKGGALYNNNRIAEVWLEDEYKRAYYRAIGDPAERKFGNVTERLELKKKLGCKSFKWFAENVHTKLGIPYDLSDAGWEKTKKRKEEERKKKEDEERMKKEEEERKMKEEEERKKEEENDDDEE